MYITKFLGIVYRLWAWASKCLLGWMMGGRCSEGKLLKCKWSTVAQLHCLSPNGTDSCKFHFPGMGREGRGKQPEPCMTRAAEMPTARSRNASPGVGSCSTPRLLASRESALLVLSFWSGMIWKWVGMNLFFLVDSSHLSLFKDACRIGTLLWKLVSSCCTWMFRKLILLTLCSTEAES